MDFLTTGNVWETFQEIFTSFQTSRQKHFYTLLKNDFIYFMAKSARKMVTKWLIQDLILLQIRIQPYLLLIKLFLRIFNVLEEKKRFFFNIEKKNNLNFPKNSRKNALFRGL